MKKPVKKMGGGMMQRPATMPKPNAMAMEKANANARFKRPEVTTMPVREKPAMPMRRAKGGMAKGKK